MLLKFKIRSVIFLISVMCCSAFAKAYQKTASNTLQSIDQSSSDSTFIKSYTDKIILKANVDTEIDSYNYKTGDGSELVLRNNNRYRAYLSVDYEFIGFTVGFAPQFLPDNNDDDLKGSSELTDFRFRFFLGKWTQEVQYKSLEGFYVNNTTDLIPGWMEDRDPFIQLPEFKSQIYSGSTAYVFNTDFSYRNFEYDTEWQLKSAGSFVPNISYAYRRLSAPIEGKEEFENNFDVSLSPSYLHTFVLNTYWFAAIDASPGLGLRFSTSGREDIEARERNVYVPIVFNGGLKLGYSSPKIIFGASANLDYIHMEEGNNTTLDRNDLYLKVYFGYRFDAPKFISSSFKKINDTLGL